MDCPQRAVFFLEEDASVPAYSKPLMLETVLFCPILSWMSEKLRSDGVQRFFAVCGPRFAQEARSCFPEDAEVIVSEQHQELLSFLDTDETTLVFRWAALPAAEAGPGFAYAAPGRELRSTWRERLTNAVQGAELVGGWLPVNRRENLDEMEQLMRPRVIRRHSAAGVRIMDPGSVYIDPRVTIGTGTVILPGTILRGESRIGCGCTIGPNALVDCCTVGDGVAINASQTYESTIGAGADVGPYAHIRPNCTVGEKCHVGAFVQLKNCVLGAGTKMSHLTYVGDADVGERVNFGCGTITSNYDGFKKHRTVIEDDVFVGCNTNLVPPVTVGRGAYIAAGTTVTRDVPPDALTVGRVRQENKEGWAARRRKMHQK